MWFLALLAWMSLIQACFLTVAIAADATTSEAPPNPRIIEHPTKTIVPQDEAVTLNCRAAGDPEPKITWYKDGKLLLNQLEEPRSRRVHLPSGSLFFLDVQDNAADSDAGVYWCVAENKHGTARSQNATLEVALLKDEFRVRPKNVQAVIGDQAILECSPPKGYPEPTVTWKKNDRDLRINDHPRYKIHDSGNLIISSVQQEDAGVFACVARNMAGTKESNEVRLTVYEKPRFIREPSDVTTELGGDVVFSCKVSGDPMPVIVWRKNGGKMPLGRAQIIENRGLRIDRVIPKDAGEYVCEAKNPAGSIRASAKLIVQSPPTFSVEPADQTVEEGGSITFECAAEGNPLPDKFWSKQGEQNLMFPGITSPDGRMGVSLDGELRIEFVKASDQGYYVCSALNTAGSNIAKAYLKVKGRTLVKPPPPVITLGPANQTIPLASLAILPCKATSSKPVSLSWVKDGVPVKMDDRFAQMTSGALQISDLKKTDAGVYTCKAANEDGETTWSASLLVAPHTDGTVQFHRMPDPSLFPSAPSKPVSTNVTARSISLSWKPPNKQGASAIVGYLLQMYNPDNDPGWVNIQAVVRHTRYTVENLLPDSSYVFLVRAENSHGISEPSPMSNVFRTMGGSRATSKQRPSSREASDIELARRLLGSHQMVKLSDVKALNSTAVKLFWTLKRHERPNFVQGYYIKWQGPSSLSTPQERRWINVTSPTRNNYIIGGLQPYTTYKFFITPYYKAIEGMPSNILDGLTKQAGPSAPPTDVSVRMMNMTTLRISWRPPPPSHINGILRGYLIVVRGNSSRYHRNITTNERAASVTLFRLIPGMTYRIQVAAFTAGGMGAFHGMDVVTMSNHKRYSRFVRSIRSCLRWRSLQDLSSIF